MRSLSGRLRSAAGCATSASSSPNCTTSTAAPAPTGSGCRAARRTTPPAPARTRIRQQPRDLLRGIPGLGLTEVGDGGTCCGSAGVYNLVQPQAAAELGERKATALRATGARLVVSANPGCSLQIAAALAADGGEPVAVAHIAEVLDASFRGLPLSALGVAPAM
jgi:hypothetical protein